MVRTLSLLAMLAAFALSVVDADAAQKRGKKPKPLTAEQKEQVLNAAFDLVDKNKDERLDVNEFRKAYPDAERKDTNAEFKKLDKDSDGKLTKDEFKAGKVATTDKKKDEPKKKK